jgi:hypothetical protein
VLDCGGPGRPGPHRTAATGPTPAAVATADHRLAYGHRTVSRAPQAGELAEAARRHHPLRRRTRPAAGPHPHPRSQQPTRGDRVRAAHHRHPYHGVCSPHGHPDPDAPPCSRFGRQLASDQPGDAGRTQPSFDTGATVIITGRRARARSIRPRRHTAGSPRRPTTHPRRLTRGRASRATVGEPHRMTSAPSRHPTPNQASR